MTDDKSVDEPPIVLEDADGTEVVEDPSEVSVSEEITPADEVLNDSNPHEDDNEAVEPEYATPNATAPSDGSRHATPAATSSLLNLESLINGYIVDLEKLQEKMKTQREMFNDAFNNDAEYSQIMAKVKDANRVKSAAKQRIMKLPNVVELANKMREYKDEIKDIQEGLSSYLQQYQQLSGNNQITNDNGEVRQIVNTAKLVKVKV
jgi:hypothetical protein